MAWTTERARRLTALLPVLLVVACTAPVSPTPTPGRSGPTPTATPTVTASASPAASSGLALPEPGRPYDAGDILEAMASSPRPDGVPDELQTDAIAAAIVDAIWTYDGAPWERIVIEGTCGATCTLDVAGSRAGASADDAWTFRIDPSTGAVSVLATDLRGVPEEVAAALDRLARRLAGDPALPDLQLTSVAWRPPPDDDSFALSYRSGGEEGSCAVDVVIDARRGTLLDERSSDC